ncbi:MAG: hypothetical protein R3C68_12120 [Myxococcota bacterium]
MALTSIRTFRDFSDKYDNGAVGNGVARKHDGLVEANEIVEAVRASGRRAWDELVDDLASIVDVGQRQSRPQYALGWLKAVDEDNLSGLKIDILPARGQSSGTEPVPAGSVLPPLPRRRSQATAKLIGLTHN